jgi:hypothetical protein
MENLEPLEKINKLIELYITKIHCNAEIYKIPILNSHLKEINLETCRNKKGNLKTLEQSSSKDKKRIV